MNGKGSSAALAVAGAGAAATVFNSIGAALLISLPAADARAQEIADYLQDNRTALLIGGYAWGLGTSTILVFAAALRSWLPQLQSRWTANAAFAAAATLVALLYLGFGTLTSVAFRPPESPDTVRFVHGEVYVLLAYAGFAAALWNGLISWIGYRAGFGRRWIHHLGVASAVTHLIAAGALATGGVASPSGPAAYVAPTLISGWIGALALLAWTSGRSGRLAQIFWGGL